MNNGSIGGLVPLDQMENEGAPQRAFAYYETIGGRMGSRPNADGPSALHSHMTNTLNTPIEALEYAYPLHIMRYEVRHDSGRLGRFRGGDGIRRDIQVLTDCQVTLLTDRRVLAPYGLAGGKPGQSGENVLLRDGKEIPLPAKGTIEMKAGEILSIRTPGGGGYGTEKN